MEAGVDASLTRFTHQPWEIEYAFCLSLFTQSAVAAEMKFRRAEYTLLTASGQTYRSVTDTGLIGQQLSSGRVQCLDLVDFNVNQPIAPQFRIIYEFGTPGATESITRTFTGAVRSRVPPLPFITSATLTEDIGDVQNILRQPGPITFTAHVEGGTAPFLYQFRINGFLLRDWSPDPVFVWPGQSLNNQPLVSGGYTATVNVRRSTWNESEIGASVSFLFLFF
jgi:hypothetical protein